MIDKVLDNVVKYSMFDKGDKVIVAVSGGPDSICLLHCLYKLREKLGITIYAAHLNHCLRGREADMDEEYVKDFCNKLNIEFRSRKVDVNKLSKDKNISCESAGRKARYDFFYELKRELNAQKIAIAHNANDQAETVLMRIMRGTGLDGLVGIRPVRDKIFVRPLINITRSQIENYCILNDLNPRIDKTNLETIYSRNKIRLELIPYIQKNFNEDIIKTLNRLSDTIKVDNDYLDMISKEKFKKYCDINEEKVIISKGAFVEHKAIVTRIIRLAIYNLCGNLYNLDKSHIYQILSIQSNSTGKTLNLPDNIKVINNYGDIYIYKARNDTDKKVNREYKLSMGVNELKEENLIVELSLVKNEDIENLNSSKLIKYFNYDKIRGEIVLRHKKNGDRFIPLGMNGSKKLKDFFIDEKVIKDQREKIPIICFNNEISWIVGYRMSEVFKVTENTKNILQIKIKGERTKECIK